MGLLLKPDGRTRAADVFHWNSTRTSEPKSDGWEQALEACYFEWELTKPLTSSFSANIRKRPIDDVNLIECRCHPCSGRRVLAHATRDGQAYVGVQIVVSGAERFRIGDKTVEVGSGDVVFWNSWEATEFEVLEELHKITLLMPQTLLESRLELGLLVRGGVIQTTSAIGGLLFSHIRALASDFDRIGAAEINGIKWSTVELCAAAAVALQQPITSPCQNHIRRLQRYIIEHLQDSELSVERIAKDNSISVRYVHSLFNSLGTTVSTWIMDRRLERCRDALAARRDGRGLIKDVALQWGFSDATYFGRVFKARYGVTPLSYWKLQSERQDG